MGNPILDSDWFDGCLGWVVVGIIVVSVFGAVALAIAVGYSITHPSTPSLFCENGTIVHSSPTTEIVGKVPVDGTLYSCQGGR